MRCGCGGDNREGARFCDSCGAELAASDAPTAVDTATDVSLSPGFVGRHREMAELTAALDDALVGRGRLVMLAGEPGIGKTRTAQELAAHAEQRGAQVWWGRCYEGEGAPPYWPWVQPIRSYVHQRDAGQLRSEMGPGAADIAEIVPETRDKLPDLKPSPALEPEEARFRLFDSITTFLTNASRAQPLVLVIDDLHWADASSLLLLEFLAREIAQCPMLLVGTYRDAEVSRRHPLSRTLGSLMRERPFQRVQLRGLTQQDTGRFVEARAGVIPPAALVEEVHKRTEGNPMFLGEVVGLLTPEEVQEGRWSAAGIPEGIRDAIGRRLDRLSQECNGLLTTASVVGWEFDFELLRALSQDIDESQLLESLDEALEAGAIEDIPGRSERYRFSHALIHQTLSEELSSSRRTRLHARIGEALEEIHGADADAHAAELAHHFAQAEAVVGTQKLVRFSRVAGEQALAAYAYEAALAHFQRALVAKGGRAPGQIDEAPDSETAALLFGLGRAQVPTLQGYQLQEAVDNLTRAFDYYAEAGEVERALAVAQTPFPLMLGLTGVPQLLTRALELSPPDSYEAACLLPEYIRAIGVDQGDYEAGREAIDQGLAIARREKDDALEASLLYNASWFDFFHLRFQDSIEHGEKATELVGDYDPSKSLSSLNQFVIRASLVVGDLKRARLHAAAMLPREGKRYHSVHLRHAFALNAYVCRLAGDWKKAQDLSDRGLEVASREVSNLGPRTALEYEIGEFEAGEEFLERLLGSMRSMRAGPNWSYSIPAVVIAIVARITGATARSDVAESAAQVVLSSPNVTPLQAVAARTSLAMIAVQREDISAAATQYAALVPQTDTMAGWMMVSADRLLGLLAQTMGNLDDAAAHFDDALAFCRNAGYRPELAWSHHDYADALLQRNGPGDHQRALELLDDALATSTELGMKPLMKRVTALQERAESLPAKAPAHPAGLTQREVEVLRLIAAGKSNQDIAEELVISVNTVFRHVSNIFSKTGASNRVEATTYATRHGIVS